MDASTTPDQPDQRPRRAGIGVFILILQEQSTPQAIYIKAKLHGCTSVLMAEAAALALASVVTNKFNLTGVTFLSDNEQLVHFLNKEDLSNPPDWRIKPFTQLFSNYSDSRSSKVSKIHCGLNTTAHTLARQAYRDPSAQDNSLVFNCSSEHHVPQCSWILALQDVHLKTM